MHQASVLDGLSFDPFSFQQDGVASAEVNIGRCQAANGLMVTPVVVMIDEEVEGFCSIPDATDGLTGAMLLRPVARRQAIR